MTSLRNLLLALLLIFNTPVFAQWVPTANLTIFSEDGAKFFLILNGERYNDVAQTNIRIEELPNPYYNCKVVFEDKSIPDISKNALMLADADGAMQDVTYRIKKDNKGKNVLRFYSQIPAQQNMVRPSNCATYRFGAPNMIVGNVISTTTTSQTSSSPANNVNVQVGGIGLNVSIAQPLITNTTTTTVTTTRTGGNAHDDFAEDHLEQGSNRNNANGRRRAGCAMTMNNVNFDEAKRTVAANGFDETRLSTAKQIASSNCLSTNQIAALIKIFSFEESKLDFAKYAYDFCVDRNNYFKIVNSFSFESSKTELNDYIQSMR
jgi:hypothetical protein